MNRLSLFGLVAFIGTIAYADLPPLRVVSGGSSQRKVSAEVKPIRVSIPRDTPPPDPEPTPTPTPTPGPAPYVTLPATLNVVAGGWLSIDADTNCPKVKFLSPDAPNSLFPDGKLIDQVGTVFSNPTPGQYKIMGVGASGDQPALSNWCVITVQGAQPPPGPPQPPAHNPPTPPTPAPVTKATRLIISTIDNAELRGKTPGLAQFLADPYWQLIRSKGHLAKQYNSTNANAMNTYSAQIQANGGLPTIIIMDANGNKWLNKDPADLKLPADAASLKALLSKYTDNL